MTRLRWSAVVNREFARKVFGSVDKAMGEHFKFWGGKRAEVVGVVEDGKYETLTEDPKPAMFFSFLQQRSSDTWIIVRSQRDPGEIATALRQSMHSLDPALPLEIRTWSRELDSALFAARVATVALGVLGLLGAMLAITGHLRHGLLYREQAPARVWHPDRSRRESATGAKAQRWGALSGCSPSAQWRG